MYRCLVYCSQAVADWLPADLVGLLAAARTFNAAHGITGRLTFVDRTFVQVLEGPPGAVGSLFAAIARDPHHRAVVVMMDRTVQARAFGHWAMDFTAPEPQSAAENADPGGLLAGIEWSDVEIPSVRTALAALAAGPRPRAALRVAPQQQRAQATVDRLLAASWGIVRSGGAGALTLARAARAAGITRAAAYRYFSTLDHLLAGMTADWHRRALARWVAGLDDVPLTGEVDLAEKLAAFMTLDYLLPPFLTEAAQAAILNQGVSAETLAAWGSHTRAAMNRANLPAEAAMDDASLVAMLGGMAGAARSVARHDPAMLGSVVFRQSMIDQCLRALQSARNAAISAR